MDAKAKKQVREQGRTKFFYRPHFGKNESLIYQSFSKLKIKIKQEVPKKHKKEQNHEVLILIC